MTAPNPNRLTAALALGIVVGGAHAAVAATPTIQIPTEDAFEPDQANASTGGPFGFLNGISRSSYMLGDMWGLRPALA